jgi:hypothetical protein
VLGHFDPHAVPPADPQADPSFEPWRVNRWHLQMLNRTGSDGWELMYIQAHEGNYHYVFKRPAL